MTLELAFFLLAVEVEHFDGGVLVSDNHEGVGLVKDGAVGTAEPRVELAHLLDHADVPHLVDAVRVSRHDHVSFVVELDAVN